CRAAPSRNPAALDSGERQASQLVVGASFASQEEVGHYLTQSRVSRVSLFGGSPPHPRSLGDSPPTKTPPTPRLPLPPPHGPWRFRTFTSSQSKPQANPPRPPRLLHPPHRNSFCKRQLRPRATVCFSPARRPATLSDAQFIGRRCPRFRRFRPAL